ncbi:MAG: SGNH/GDSL hydrolase family protein [Lachnospiraceae bacterium]|nr:SGNH/GDSL hydrolase family protein [Lachnospiraceae bacterium]
MEKKFVRRFFIQSISFFLLIAAVVILTDPFYHYHAPAAGLKAVINKAEYQCIGTIRNFKYDGLMLGSSMAENYNNRWLDEAFGCTTIKGIKSSASTADLLYYLDEAYQNHELKYVFYNLDLSALSAGPEHHFTGEGMPTYLYNNNILDDVNYLFNKDVLFESVPYLIAVSMQQDYDEGTSYNWAQYKTFSQEDALLHYERPPVSEAAEFGADEREVIDANVSLLAQMAEAHPETEFYFFYPPYSLLWWDSVDREGRLEERLYAAGRAAEVLTACENLHLYSSLAEEDIVCNLDFYMDSMHFSADINRWIVNQRNGSEYLLTKQNYEEELERLRRLVERMIEYDIPAYFPEN